MCFCYKIIFEKRLDKVIVCAFDASAKPAFYHVLKRHPDFHVGERQCIDFHLLFPDVSEALHFQVTCRAQYAPYCAGAFVQMAEYNLFIQQASSHAKPLRWCESHIPWLDASLPLRYFTWLVSHNLQQVQSHGLNCYISHPSNRFLTFCRFHHFQVFLNGIRYMPEHDRRNCISNLPVCICFTSGKYKRIRERLYSRRLLWCKASV